VKGWLCYCISGVAGYGFKDVIYISLVFSIDYIWEILLLGLALVLVDFWSY
jgi:hypothetical protein